MSHPHRRSRDRIGRRADARAAASLSAATSDPGTEPTGPRWLDDHEMAAWLPLIRLVYLLPQALDRQLREQVGISHTYYSMLVTLSAQPEHTLSMGELARLTAASPSRLSHAVASMESRGWVRRRPCPSDKRIQYATLTDDGCTLLERIAPTHVAEVRRLVFDRLRRDQVDQLRALGMTLLEGLDGLDGLDGLEPLDDASSAVPGARLSSSGPASGGGHDVAVTAEGSRQPAPPR